MPVYYLGSANECIILMYDVWYTWCIMHTYVECGERHTQERRSPLRRADASCASFSRSGDRILWGIRGVRRRRRWLAQWLQKNCGFWLWWPWSCSVGSKCKESGSWSTRRSAGHTRCSFLATLCTSPSWSSSLKIPGTTIITQWG